MACGEPVGGHRGLAVSLLLDARVVVPALTRAVAALTWATVLVSYYGWGLPAAEPIPASPGAPVDLAGVSRFASEPAWGSRGPSRMSSSGDEGRRDRRVVRMDSRCWSKPPATRRGCSQHQRGRLGIDRQTITPGNPYGATGTISSAEQATQSATFASALES